MPPEPDLPADTLPPAVYWTQEEKWIWDCTLAGKVADFNVRYDEADPLDPKQDDARWSDDGRSRLVSEKFLLDVLGRKSYLEAIPRRGLRIRGAYFPSNLNLQSLHVERQVWLEGSRFEGAVHLNQAKFDAILSFKVSAFNQVLDMNGATVGQSLVLEGARFVGAVDLGGAKVDGVYASGATFEADLNMNTITIGKILFLRHRVRFWGDVDLCGAKVDGQLDASGATFEAGLNMNGLRVGHLLLPQSRFVGEVDLSNVKVDGQLDASSATFEAGLDMYGLTVGQALFLSDGARFVGRVNLVGAKVDGQLTTRGATFEASLDMQSLITKDLLLDGATFAGEVLLVFAEIGGLNLGGATFRAPVNASGLTAKGELILDPPPTWGESSRFVLRNAHIGALNDGGAANENPWPERGKLELDGFSYGRLGGSTTDSSTELRPRKVRWYIDHWLALDTSYAPQPYQQLAGVLRAHGDPSGANDVLYAARERERTEAGRQSLVGGAGPKERAEAALRWFGLSLLKWTMGYGLGVRYFRVLPWVAGLTLLGALILWTSEADQVQSVAGIDRPADTSATEVDLGNEARTALQHQAPSDRKAAAIQVEPKNRNGFVWCLWASFDWMLPFVELDEASTEAVAGLQGGPGYLLYFQALAGYVLAGFLAAGLAGLTQSRD